MFLFFVVLVLFLFFGFLSQQPFELYTQAFETSVAKVCFSQAGTEKDGPASLRDRHANTIINASAVIFAETRNQLIEQSLDLYVSLPPYIYI